MTSSFKLGMLPLLAFGPLGVAKDWPAAVLVRCCCWCAAAVLAAFLLLWGASLELEGGAFLAVGELRVRAGEELADAAVSYALP